MAVLDLGKVVPEKGVDYFTASDIAEIENGTAQKIETDLDFTNTINGINQDINNLKTNKADKTEIAGFITKDVQDLTYYYKSSETYTKTEIDGKVLTMQRFCVIL